MWTMVSLRHKKAVVLATVALSVAMGVVNASGVGPALLAHLNAPLGGAVTEAGLVGGVPAARDVGQPEAAAPPAAVEALGPEEAAVALEEARARWFALVYEGRNFDPGPAWEPAHP